MVRGGILTTYQLICNSLMNKYVYGAGSIAAAIATGVMPLVAIAQTEGEVKVEVTAVTTEVVPTTVAPAPKPTLYGEKRVEMRGEIKDMRAEARTEIKEKMIENRAEVKAMVGEKREMTEEERAEIKQKREENRAEVKDMREEIKDKREAVREEMKQKIEARIEFKEEATTRAVSLDDLRKKREERRAEFVGEEGSTTPKFRNVVKNANEVRSAVRSLLESEGLTGGIGPRISEIAKRMNDSVGTTTNAEVQIESRGFLRKALFGGDRTAAEALQAGVEKNKADIAEISTLLADPSVSAEVSADLTAQIEVLEKAQDRLANLATAETNRRSLFGWLFR